MPGLHDLAWPRRTERLLIRPATEADAAACWDYVRRPEVNGWLLEVFDDEAVFTERFVRALPNRVMVEHGGTVVGHLNVEVGDALAMADVAERARGVEGELGWCFDPTAGGRGLATEAATDLLAVAFDGLGLRRVWASCFAGNTPSWRLMERIGMRRELASKEEALHRTLGWQDGYLYALLASEWRDRARRRLSTGRAPGGHRT